MDAIECSEIVSRLRNRLTGNPTDALTLAHCAGMWLEPRIGAACERFARRLVYDPSADHEQQIARSAVHVLLEAEGFADVADVTVEQLDKMARQLIVVPPRQQAQQLSA